MIDILHHVIPENEESGGGRVVKAVKGLEEDIKRLLRYGLRIAVRDGCWQYYSTLDTVKKDLAEILAENGWVISLYKKLNASTLEDGMKQISTVTERFTVCIWINVAHGLVDWRYPFPAC
jgi:hypothetical protein